MATLRPQWMAADFFGPGVALVGRLPLQAGPWAPQAPWLQDALSGAVLAFSGAMPTVCAASTATPEILGLLAEAGLPRASEVMTYAHPGDYLSTLARAAASGLRLATFHPHPPEQVEPARCAVAPVLIAALMDKARLDEIVAPDCLAPRRVLAALPDDPEDLLREGPAVLKVATGLPNGGGLGVRPVRTREEAASACAELAEGGHWVLERWLPFERSVCVHAGVLADGRAVYLGAAEQIFAAPFRHAGNWVDGASEVPEAVARTVVDAAARAAARGYRGLAGFDVGFLPGGGWRILDANFRLNASSTAVLYRAAILAATGATTLKLTQWTARDGPTLLASARRHLRRGWLVPLSLYDPAVGAQGGPARLRGVLLAASRAEAEARGEEMARDFQV